MFPSTNFPQLKTERLLLREITLLDREALFASYSDPEISKWFLSTPCQSVSLVEEIINDFVSSYNNASGITWAIVMKKPGVFLGSCGYEWVKVNLEGEIGFDLAKEYWGKGLMTEALTAVISFGFNTMGLEKVVSSTYSNNLRAIRMLERLGFSSQPETHDSLLFTLTRKDWITIVSCQVQQEGGSSKG